MKNKKIFRKYISLDEAIRRINDRIKSIPIESEKVLIEKSLGSVIFKDITSRFDVPPFDKALMDGYAIRAQDTFGAEESKPIKLKLIGKIEAGEEPNYFVNEGMAVEISTGAPMPRGANAVIMVEYVKSNNDYIEIYKSSIPGENLMETGSDIRVGEIILRQGQRITAKELGLLAAIGLERVEIYKKPKVAIISTGNELISTREPIQSWKIFDINSNTFIGAVNEAGGLPTSIGIVPDNIYDIRKNIDAALDLYDLVMASGSTSTGTGDHMLSLMEELGNPGVIVPGISIKPGKPTIVAMVDNKMIFCLPGNPTSALAIFHLIVRPIISKLAGFQNYHEFEPINGIMSSKVHSAKGRLELLPVHLLKDRSGSCIAHPTFGNSASITTFAMADGFIIIPENCEIIEEREKVEVIPFSQNFKPVEMVFIGSHCPGLNEILSLMRKRDPSIKMKSIYVGSLEGLNAIKKKEADIAGVHIFDESSKKYNVSLIKKHGLSNKSVLVRGYRREQGFIVQKGNPKNIESFKDLIIKKITFINRNIGSGTRLLIDMNLKKITKETKLDFKELTSQIEGYHVEAKSHSAVAAAISQDKADVGVGIKTVAQVYDLDFFPIMDEHYDFLIMKESLGKESIKLFQKVLRSEEFKELLTKKFDGLKFLKDTGKVIKF